MNHVTSDPGTLIEDVSSLILIGDNYETGFEDALARLGRFFFADEVSLTKIGSEEGRFSFIATWSKNAFSEEEHNPWVNRSMMMGHTLVERNNNANASSTSESGDRVYWIRIPIFQSGKVAFCLSLYWKEGKRELNNDNLFLVLEPAARMFQSILQSKQVNSLLQTISRSDRLTGLVNRSVALDRLEKAMARSRRNHNNVAVIHLNIDRFKAINDALGYLNGDYLLKAVAKRIVDMFREVDTIARIGNDDFLVILEDVNSKENLGYFLRRIKNEFKTPVFIGGQNVHVQLSQGVLVYSRELGGNAEDMLRDAEIAMKNAKETGGNQVSFYSEDMNAGSKRRLGLEHDLHRALERGEFQLYFQPQLCLKTGQIIGAESLIRWPHPELGMLPPSEFLWIAEETGLIVPLSEWILNEACKTALHWYSSVSNKFQVAVNVSPRWFGFSGFPEMIESALKRVNMPPGCLEFEITEDVVLSNTDTTGPLLAYMKELGVKLTLDDFGTGYSSLSYLRNIPVNALKIDRSFVSNLKARKTDAAIVMSLITLCNELDIQIVAEGVETGDQLLFLRNHGCHLAQGYHIGRPQPFSDMDAMVQTFRHTAVKG